MGRMAKDTADYYSHWAKKGKTVTILEARWRNDGYAFWFKLLELLCQEEGFYYDFSDETAREWLLAYTGVNEITGAEILKLLASLGNLDRILWEEHQIIWCQALVDSFTDMYSKRSRALPIKPGAISAPEMTPPTHNEEDNRGGNDHRIESEVITGDIRGGNATKQSRAEQSIEEQSKAERARPREEAAAASATAVAQEEEPDRVGLPASGNTPLNLDTLSARLLSAGFGIASPVITDIFRGLQKKGEGWDFLEFAMTKAAGKEPGKREGFLIWAIVKKDDIWLQWKREKPPPRKQARLCPDDMQELLEVSGLFTCPKCRKRWELEGGELVEFQRVGAEVLPPKVEEEEEIPW